MLFRYYPVNPKIHLFGYNENTKMFKNSGYSKPVRCPRAWTTGGKQASLTSVVGPFAEVRNGGVESRRMIDGPCELVGMAGEDDDGGWVHNGLGCEVSLHLLNKRLTSDR